MHRVNFGDGYRSSETLSWRHRRRHQRSLAKWRALELRLPMVASLAIVLRKTSENYRPNHVMKATATIVLICFAIVVTGVELIQSTMKRVRSSLC